MYIYMLVPRSSLLREHSGILRENNRLSESAIWPRERSRAPQDNNRWSESVTVIIIVVVVVVMINESVVDDYACERMMTYYYG
jgi:hypothetical protein